MLYVLIGYLTALNIVAEMRFYERLTCDIWTLRPGVEERRGQS